MTISTNPIPSRHGTTVTVFGAGVSGMTAAHELAARGFTVTVVEASSSADRSERERVTVGGLAKTQFDTGTHAHPFPTGDALDEADDAQELLLYGEHGYRFFPSYYRHLFDTMQRTPIYADGEVTRFTAYDNVVPCSTQATAGTDQHPLVAIPRDAVDSSLVGDQSKIIQEAGYQPTDIAYLAERMLQYMSSSVERRKVYEQISSYDFFVGVDEPGGTPTIRYSPKADEQLNYMPKVLVAFDGKFGDARTNIDNWAQMMLNGLEQLPKTDGILNGPTSTAWLDHWRRHLRSLGVRFRVGKLTGLQVVDDGVLATVASCDGDDGPFDDLDEADRLSILCPDYVVVATDVVTAQCVTSELPAVGVPRGLRGYTTATPPTDPPGGQFTLQHPTHPPHVYPPEQECLQVPPDPSYRPGQPEPTQRDPYRSPGLEPWDRLQTLTGIQYFFDTEFDLLQGRIYYGNTDWGLSSVSQVPYWTKKPTVTQDQYASIMSVDIGNATTKSKHTGKTMFESTRAEIAIEVWRQIVEDLGTDHIQVAHMIPTPRWYTIDEHLVFDDDGDGPLVKNMAPYLVPIVDDWDNRPGAEPWEPGGPSTATANRERGVWQAAHGGSWVHFDSLVFAGTYLKTFTRLTTMESANESARHAVNGILDHWLWKQSAGRDPRDEPGLKWLVPYGYPGDFHSNPVRQPTPIGDYCFIQDMENHEIPSLDPIRKLDALLFEHGLPHPFVLNGLEANTIISSQVVALLHEAMPSGHPGDTAADKLLDMLRRYRQWLESIMHGGHYGHDHHRHDHHGHDRGGWGRGQQGPGRGQQAPNPWNPLGLGTTPGFPPGLGGQPGSPSLPPELGQLSELLNQMLGNSPLRPPWS